MNPVEEMWQYDHGEDVSALKSAVYHEYRSSDSPHYHCKLCNSMTMMNESEKQNHDQDPIHLERLKKLLRKNRIKEFVKMDRLTSEIRSIGYPKPLVYMCADFLFF